MDIVSGFSAVSTAIGTARDLREIDPSVDDATFKLKIAELTEALADTKIALSDAKIAISEKDIEIFQLKTQIDEFKNGELCPFCRTAKLKHVTSRPPRNNAMHISGIQEFVYQCMDSSCGHEEIKLHDPNGILNK